METAEIQKLEQQAAEAQAKADEIKAKLKKKRHAHKVVLQRQLGAKLMTSAKVTSLEELAAYVEEHDNPAPKPVKMSDYEQLALDLGKALMTFNPDIQSLEDLTAYQAKVQADLGDLGDLEDELRDFASDINQEMEQNGSQTWVITKLDSWMNWVLTYKQEPSK
jgi:hypothetical protein